MLREKFDVNQVGTTSIVDGSEKVFAEQGKLHIFATKSRTFVDGGAEQEKLPFRREEKVFKFNLLIQS